MSDIPSLQGKLRTVYGTNPTNNLPKWTHSRFTLWRMSNPTCGGDILSKIEKWSWKWNFSEVTHTDTLGAICAHSQASWKSSTETGLLRREATSIWCHLCQGRSWFQLRRRLQRLSLHPLHRSHGALSRHDAVDTQQWTGYYNTTIQRWPTFQFVIDNLDQHSGNTGLPDSYSSSKKGW